MRYSEFVHFPIELRCVKTVQKEIEIEADANAENAENADNADNAENADVKKSKTISEQVSSYEQINVNKAIWLRDRTTITTEEYNAFYKSFTKDNQDSLHY